MKSSLRWRTVQRKCWVISLVNSAGVRGATNTKIKRHRQREKLEHRRLQCSEQKFVFWIFVCDVGKATEGEKTSANCTVPLCFDLGVPSLCYLMWCRCCVVLSHFPSLATITARCTRSQPLSHSDKNNSRLERFPSETGQSDTSITSAHLVAPSLHSRYRNFTFTLGSLIFQIREQFQNGGPEVAFTIWCSITKLNHGFGHGSNEISIASFEPTGEEKLAVDHPARCNKLAPVTQENYDFEKAGSLWPIPRLFNVCERSRK